MRRIPVLWLAGPSGVGKTAVAWTIYTELTDAGIDAAYVDIDQLGMCYPEPLSDPGRYAMKTRNAEAIVSNFRDAGARCVVISGVIDPVPGPGTDRFVGADLTLCWLTANAVELRRRFTERGTRPDEIDAAIRGAEDVDAAGLADVVVDTSGVSVDGVAKLVRQEIGAWPDLDARGEAQSDVRSVRGTATGGHVLFFCGAAGVGKSSVGFAVYLKALPSGSMTAYVDVDQLAFMSGRRADHRLRARNLASVWRTFREAGAQALVAVANVEHEDATKIYVDALPGATVTWCRLHATPERLTERVLLRGEGRGSWPEPGDPLQGRPTAVLLQVAREAEAVADAMQSWSTGIPIDTDGLTVEGAANIALERTRWLENLPPA